MADFLIVIPARLASSRLPNKPLADIAGKPMIVRVAEQAAKTRARIVVASDDQSIHDVVVQAGFESVLTRVGHSSGTDRLAEVVELLGLDDDTIIVNVQGDEPLIEPALIVAAAQTLIDHPECAIATVAHPIHTMADFLNPNIVKVTLDAQGRALTFSRADLDALQNHPESDTRQSFSLDFYRLCGLSGRHAESQIQKTADPVRARHLYQRTQDRSVSK